eukprot:GHVT01079427.1.p1 GENE.GHVT01079427.1~~GHVT01079427.1.p1  ORF type:complete len:258 (+),score=39.96 GHVT01079427.1:580-1353(+)
MRRGLIPGIFAQGIRGGGVGSCDGGTRVTVPCAWKKWAWALYAVVAVGFVSGPAERPRPPPPTLLQQLYEFCASVLAYEATTTSTTSAHRFERPAGTAAASTLRSKPQHAADGADASIHFTKEASVGQVRGSRVIQLAPALTGPSGRGAAPRNQPARPFETEPSKQQRRASVPRRAVPGVGHSPPTVPSEGTTFQVRLLVAGRRPQSQGETCLLLFSSGPRGASPPNRSLSSLRATRLSHECARSTSTVASGLGSGI